jgi:hypothetical protein
VQDGRTYIELINGHPCISSRARLPRCLIDAADCGCIRMLTEIAMRRAQRRCALFIQPSLRSVGIAHLPPRCEEIRNARPVMLATYFDDPTDHILQAADEVVRSAQTMTVLMTELLSRANFRADGRMKRCMASSDAFIIVAKQLASVMASAMRTGPCELAYVASRLRAEARAFCVHDT